MKVFILALDALEYDFVERWDLKYLKQKVYGRIELGERYNPSWGDEPYTPIVFHSFISGLPPEKHKIESVATYGKTLDFLRKLVKFKFTGGVDGGRGWKGDVKVMLLDVSKLKSLGWKPKYNSEVAVRKTAEHLTKEITE